MIHSLKKAYPIVLMCALMGAARSSYYMFSRARNQRQRSPELLDAARQIDVQGRCSYGSRRMSQALHLRGHAVGRYRARSLM